MFREMISKVALLISFITLASCSTSSSISVVNPEKLNDNFTVSSILVKDSTAKLLDIDIEKLMKVAVEKELSKQGILDLSDNGYILRISIINYAKGNAFARWMLPGAGKTSLSVKADVFNNQEILIANAQAERSVSAGGGYTIGAWEQVFDDVAKALVADFLSLK